MANKTWCTSLAWLQPVFGLHILPSPNTPSARCAKGAKSPLAPTDPCSGTQDKHEAVKFYFCVCVSKSG